VGFLTSQEDTMEKTLERLRALASFRQECAARLAVITDAAETRDGKFDDAEQAEYNQLAEWVTAARAEEVELEARKAVFEAAHAPGAVVTRGDTPNFNRNRDPFDVSDISVMTGAAELRGRARTAIEQTFELDDHLRQAATHTLERAVDKRGEVPMRLLLTGTKTYRSAWLKVLSGQGQYTLDQDERDALARAASLTTTAGGFAVPFTLDSTIILTNDGAANPIRQIARVVQITTDDWNGISSAGVTASYDAEAAEVSDDAPTLAQPSITTRQARAFVPFSIQIGQDWPGMEADVRMMISDAKDNLEATVFWSGAAASNQPIGIENALAGGSSIVASNTAEVFAVTDLPKAYAALPARYRNSNTAAVAQWSTLVEARRLLAAAADRSSFNEASATMPATLYGWPIYELSTADAFSAINAAASATHHILCVGDWSNYVIADRVGMEVELIPHLFATANNLPSGQRGFFAHWRNGADSVNDAAFRMLTVTTTA
jgi:HK97 family phage major capsid protein